MAAPSIATSLATSLATAPAPFRLSVIIANYNYAAYVGAAIDSALAVDWADLEVIVVDDGSTDGSCDVIRSYGERIVAVFQPNAGQAEAHAVGFARSRGDVLIFLDADDLLDPTVAREIACVWREGVSKVQFQMKTIDAAGRDMGTVFPQFDVPPTPGLIRRWVLSANAYPTPPGSGNAYARSFLVKVFPLDGSSRASDSYFLAAAPFFGDVLTVPRPLVSYRVHGRNDAAFSELDVDRFGRELSRAMQRFSYAQRMAALAGFDLPGAVRDRSLNLLPYRLASFRLAPGQHPIASDSGAAILRDLLRAVAAPQGVSRQARVALFAWSLLVLAVPGIAARPLVLWRFAPASRPAVVQRLLTRLRIVH